MKKAIYALILPLVVIGGLVFANRETNADTSKKPVPLAPSAAKFKTGRELWEETPDGIAYKKWEACPAGQKVLTCAAKIMKNTSESSEMEAVVTSLSLPPHSRLGFGVMARIDGEDYILSFGLENGDEFNQLRNLRVNDKIIIKSHSVSWAPKYAYPIVAGNYVERDGKVLYKRDPRKDGC